MERVFFEKEAWGKVVVKVEHFNSEDLGEGRAGKGGGETAPPHLQ